MPNVFAWYAMVSKMSSESRAKWPKVKVQKPKEDDAAPK